MNSIGELISTIYEDNFSHFDFMENMASGDCDCNLHIAMETIFKYYIGEGKE